METLAPSTSGRAEDSIRRVFTVGAVVCVLVAMVVGFAMGSFWSSRHNSDTWHTGTAQTGARVFSIEYDGWTYGASGSVPQWIDREGTIHDSGWPDCLRGAGRRVPVRFQAREVTVDGTTWRPVIAIACSAG